MSSAVNVPLLSGLVVGIIFGLILLALFNKNGRIKTEYDERQHGLRGIGYKYAAYTTWGLLAVYTLLDETVELPMENAFVLMTIIWIGLLVQITYAIFKDAYWGSNNNIRKFGIFFVVITIINALAAYSRYKSGDMIVNGKLTFSGTVNLQCAIMFLILGVEMLIKKLVDKGEED